MPSHRKWTQTRRRRSSRTTPCARKKYSQSFAKPVQRAYRVLIFASQSVSGERPSTWFSDCKLFMPGVLMQNCWSTIVLCVSPTPHEPFSLGDEAPSCACEKKLIMISFLNSHLHKVPAVTVAALRPRPWEISFRGRHPRVAGSLDNQPSRLRLQPTLQVFRPKSRATRH